MFVCIRKSGVMYLSTYHQEVFDLSTARPTLHAELLNSVHIGYIKAALYSAHQKLSADKHCTILKQPLALKVNKAFSIGALKLVGLSNLVSISSKVKETQKVICVGECYVANESRLSGL